MTTPWISFVAVGLGASLGAVARWQLSERLNSKLSILPMGTLLANWIGAFAIGLAIAYLSANPKIPEAWRLFLITGLLGGLTTFSAFSMEMVQLIQHGRWAALSVGVTAHVLGSIVLTLVGIAVFQSLR
jgi:fluoride exporter